MSDVATSPTPAFVDLQVHSTASDGALPPAAVVEAAAAAHLCAMALTDHDTVDGLAEAQEAGERLGVRIVPGVELSTYFVDDELHLLGLHLAQPDTMATALERLKADRVARAEEIVAILNRHGIPLTMTAVRAEAGDAAVGRPHIARAMVAGGWVSEFRDAFDQWIGWKRPAFVPRERFEVADAITLVHDAGGLAVWAHPGESATVPRLTRLKALGLDGVECLHPSHPPYLVTRLVEHAEKVELLPSGGSDWHGTLEGPRRLGGQLVPKVWLDWQDEAIAKARIG